MIDISVIIPTYEPNNYIFQCLDSLCKQTLDFERFEIIIVLNGCKEPYDKNLLEYIGGNINLINIKLFQTNIAGVSNARNMGLDKSQGNYICFIDDDDTVSPTYLEQLFLSVSKSTIAVSNVYAFHENITLLHDDYITKCYKKNVHFNNRKIFFLRSFFSSSCCKMIPAAVIGKRRFDSTFKISEDALFMAAISDKITGVNLVLDATSVYYRRIRLGSASRKYQPFKSRIKNILLLIRAYWRIYWSNPFNYNILFFLSRICAAVISVRHKKNIL